MPATDDFPHHGEHLVNDAKMAEMTVELIAVFVMLLAIASLLVALAVT